MIFFRLVPESVRWLVAHGRSGQALRILRRGAKFNGIHVSFDAVMDEKSIDCEGDDDEEGDEAGESEAVERVTQYYTVCDMFKTPGLCRRSLVLFYVWYVS